MDPRPVVYELLERWGNKSRKLIAESDRMTVDIEMDGDDYGMSFIPELEQRLQIKAARAEWERVTTVGDILALVVRHLDRGSAGE